MSYLNNWNTYILSSSIVNMLYSMGLSKNMEREQSCIGMLIRRIQLSLFLHFLKQVTGRCNGIWSGKKQTHLQAIYN